MVTTTTQLAKSFTHFLSRLFLSVLPPCNYMYHMHTWCPRSVSDPLELELQMAVSHHVGA